MSSSGIEELKELRIRVNAALEGFDFNICLQALAEMLVTILLTFAPNEAEAERTLNEVVSRMRVLLKTYADERWRGTKPGHG